MTGWGVALVAGVIAVVVVVIGIATYTGEK